MREVFARYDVRTVRETALLTVTEATRRDTRPGARRHLAAILRSAGLELGRGPFTFLPVAARLALARRGVWSAADLENAGWTADGDWPVVDAAARARLAAMRADPRAFDHARCAIPDDVHLDHVAMSVRLSNILRELGITTTRELSILREPEFVRSPDVDRRARADLRVLLDETNVSLGQGDLGRVVWRDRLALARAGAWSKHDLRAEDFDLNAVEGLSKGTRAAVEKIRCELDLQR